MKKEPPAAPLEMLQALAEFRHRLREFLHFSETAAIGAGLEPQQHQLMLQVAGAPDGTHVTVGYVAERMGLRPNSTLELCDRCASAGLLTRRADVADRRRVLLALSRKGMKQLESLAIDHARELNELCPQLLRTLARLKPASANETAKRRVR